MGPSRSPAHVNAGRCRELVACRTGQDRRKSSVDEPRAITLAGTWIGKSPVQPAARSGPDQVQVLGEALPD